MSAIFIDRDGVINRNRSDYVKSWGEFEFLPGALEALRKLSALRLRVVVITNQSIINRGIVSRETVESVNSRMIGEVSAHGGRIDAVLYCPHRPDENCECRKPKPGLLYQAKERLNLDLSSAFFVGDHITDIEAARSAGIGVSILVLSGRTRPGENPPSGVQGTGYHVAADLDQAADIILSVMDRLPKTEGDSGYAKFL